MFRPNKRQTYGNPAKGKPQAEIKCLMVLAYTICVT